MSDSDSDNFYDAEEAPYTPDKICRSKTNDTEEKNEKDVKKEEEDSLALIITTPSELKPSDGSDHQEKLKEAQRMMMESEMRRKKMEEKLRLLAEDEESPMGGVHSETSSLASSSFSLTFPSSLAAMNSAPANTDDKQSVLSLGKVGALLGEKVDLSQTSAANSPPQTPRGAIVEPDLVASTKGDASALFSPPPIAPPRRKNKTKKSAPPSSISCETLEDPVSPVISTPVNEMVENLTKELDQSLDLESALRGQYVVKPQDREQDHADYPVTSLSTGQPLHRRHSGSAQSSGGSHKSGSSSSDAHASYRTPEGSASRSPPVQPGSMKMRSSSGRVLSDLEILEKVQVRNLDTGELIPLSQAEDRLPQCVNPLSLHIMRLTSEYVSNPELDKSRDSDEESTSSKRSGHMITAIDGKRVWYQTKKFPKLIGRKLGETVGFIKSRAEAGKRGHEDLEGPPLEEEIPPDLQFQAKTKASSSHKGPYEFEAVRIVQELEGEHVGAVWTMKFSSCGRLLATAGQDRILRIWVLNSAYATFHEMRQQYNSEGGKVSPSPSQESVDTLNELNETDGQGDVKMQDSYSFKGPFRSKPFCVYKGHTADLLDVSWSKNHFILSSSMDKTVRLWHISRKECLCCFQHIDFVTAIAFHPRDDRYFLSGSLDGKLRLWNIPDKKVALWNELEDGHSKLITAVSFCGHGKYAVVGSYDGRCVFYNTEQLKYFTQIQVRSSRGKNAQGRKITSIEPMPGDDKFLVTSNDSRIRLYDIRDLSLSCKYKGYVNTSSQIKASFSHDGKYIISGSENQFIYIWRTSHDLAKLPTVHRRDRNDFWESIKAHDALVTSAVFAPNPNLVLQNLDFVIPPYQDNGRYVILSADFNGCIKVMVNHCTVASPLGLPPTPTLSH